jgi:hypothetical protein
MTANQLTLKSANKHFSKIRLKHMVQKIILLLVLTCGFQSIAFAQETTAANAVTVYPSSQAKKYKILLHSQKVLVAKSLDSLRGKMLYITGKQGPQEVSIELINRLLVAKQKRPTLKGIAFGTLGGAAIGAAIGYLSYKEPDPGTGWFAFSRSFDTTVGAVGGGLAGIITGAIIGSVSHQYKHYTFSNLPLEEKYTLLGRVLSGK